MKNVKLQGYKGSPPPPIEVKDTIKSSGKAYIVDLLCEGEIDDLVKLYIDEAEYTTADFPSVEFSKANDFRNGKPSATQTPLSSIYKGAKVPLSLPQSTRIKKTRPITLNFNSNTYPDATSILVNVKIPSMLRQVDAKNKKAGENLGDVRQATVEYTITLTENGVSRPPVREILNQKSSGGFVWSTRLYLNPDQNRLVNEWKVKISRVTEDSQTVKISNDTYLDSVVIETSYGYLYPNSAVSSISFDAQNFPVIGQRAYDLKLLKIKVPTGYTPTQFDNDGIVTAAAVYPAIWNGTFQTLKVWTNNPAWIFYDLLTNKRYGLGEFIPEDSIDKWTLYAIAKYCDELVDKGSGESGLTGKEPRFACNLFLTTTEEAYTVVNNLSSVFRGITYWMSGKIFPVQDRPKGSTQLFTNANVINGEFSYSSTGRNQRRTVVQVRWNDPEDFYRPKVEYVEDTEGVIKFGVRDFDLAAFACTSRGQAYRAGKWALLSERLETEVVNFDTGNEGIYSRPGDVIEIYDDYRINQKQGGRTFDMFGAFNNGVVLDRIVETGSLNYFLSVSIPKSNRDPAYTGIDGNQSVTGSSQTGDIRKSFVETSTVTSMSYSGNKTVCIVSPGFSERYVGGTWILSSSHATSGIIVGSKKYRVLNIKENQDHNLSISALEYNSEKFAIAETGFTVRVSPDTDYSSSPILPPSNLTLETIFDIESTDFSAYIEASWTPSTGPYLSYHSASGRPAVTGEWVDLQVIDNGSKAIYAPEQTGFYEVVVHAVQVGGAMSSPISGTVDFASTNPLGNSVVPISGVVLKNPIQGYSNQYNDLEPIFSIYLAPSGDNDIRITFVDSVQFRLVTNSGVSISDWYDVDEGEDITIPYVDSGITGWPMRTGHLEARVVDIWGNLSNTGTFTFINPPPPSAGLSVLSKTNNSFSYLLEPNDIMPLDYSGTLFWTAKSGVRPNNYITKNGTAGEVVHNLNSDDVYVWWALADRFTLSGLNIVGPILLEVGNLSLPSVGLELGLSGHNDDWNNEHWTLYASWNRFESGNIRDYLVYLEDNSGSKYNYLVAQTESGIRPSFHFDSVSPDRDYKVRLRGRNNEGRMTALSAYSSEVNVPKPKIRFLQVEGKSYFFEPTAVRLAQQNVAISTSINYGQGNIIRANLSNAGSITLGASNIQSGATYLVYLNRTVDGGTVNFSSAYKWPDGEPPDISQDAGSVDVISAFAIDTGNLFCVVSNNFS